MLRLISSLCLAVLLAAAPMPLAAQGKDTLSPAQRQEVEKLVRDTIRANPEIVLEAIRSLQAKQEAESEGKLKATLRAEKAQIRNDAEALVYGNPKADVTVVEFFDYRCGYCKQVAPRIKELIKDDKNVRVVLKEFPILGPDSRFAARAALASRKQNKYPQFHEALMGARGRLDEAAVMQLAGEVGLDAKKLRADMDDPKIDQLLRANFEVAEKLGIQGTPAFIIGDNLVPGAVGLAQLKELVGEARTSCTTC